MPACFSAYYSTESPNTIVTLSPFTDRPRPYSQDATITDESGGPLMHDDVLLLHLAQGGSPRGQARPYPPPPAPLLAIRKVTDTDTDANAQTTAHPPDQHNPPSGHGAILPAIIAVTLFVVATVIVLKFIRVLRGSHGVTPVYRVAPAEPEKPRMWEVSLADARAPSLVGKWDALMPITVERLEEEDTRSPLTLPLPLHERRASARWSTSTAATWVPSTRSSSRSSGGRRKTSCDGLSEKLSATGFPTMDDGSRVRVAVLIAMPTQGPSSHSKATPTPSCLGMVDI